MANQQGQGFEDLRNTVTECVRIARYRWRVALVGLTVVGSLAFWYSQYVPREYTASTLFERRDDAVLQNLVQANSPYGFDHLKTTLTLDVTGSRALAKAAVKAGLVPAETFPGEGPLSEAERTALDELLTRYRLRPTVGLLHSSSSLDTISLQCVANDPEVARSFLVALRDNYIADTRARIREILSSTKAFFQSEVARLQQQVAQTESSLRSGFEDFPGLDPTDLVSVGNRLETLRLQRDTIYQRKAELEAQIAAREEFLVTAPALFIKRDETTGDPDPELPSPGAGTPVVDAALDRVIEDVRTRMVELVTARRMTMEHPEVKNLCRRMEALQDLRASLAAAAQELRGPESPAWTALPPDSHREWEAQKVRVELELESLRRQLEVASKQWEESEARVQRFASLYDRMVTSGEDLRQLRQKRNEGASELALWQGYLARLERVLTAESGERGTQFTLIEEPKDVTLPTRPRVPAIFVVCCGLGLAAAALFVTLGELFDRSFRSVGQVTRALGIPVLECVGVIPTPRERRRHLMSRLIWTPTLALLLGALLTTAGLAYASLARPALHHSAMQRVNRALNAVGIAQAPAVRDRRSDCQAQVRCHGAAEPRGLSPDSRSS